MQIYEWIMGIALIAMGLVLAVLVLMQTGKDKRLSGAIGGGTDTYYGQNKGKSRDRILGIVLAIAFYVMVAYGYKKRGQRWLASFFILK